MNMYVIIGNIILLIIWKKKNIFNEIIPVETSLAHSWIPESSLIFFDKNLSNTVRYVLSAE